MRAVVFADVLDDMLGQPAPSGLRPPVGATPLPRLAPQPATIVGPSMPAIFQWTPYARLTEPAGPVRRTARTLTTAQRRAFDAFLAMGAKLQPDFTADELRSAFRLLARRYHPDRHPGASSAELARHAACIADVLAHHKVLLTALDAPVH